MKRREFDREFKLHIVRQLLSGERRSGQLCREHNLSSSMVHAWRIEYQNKGEDAWAGPPSASTSIRQQDSSGGTPEERVKDARIAALEAALGRSHLETEFLRQALAKKICTPRRKST